MCASMTPPPHFYSSPDNTKNHNVTTSHQTGTITALSNPYVEIIEQPSSAGVRFRYKCEGRSAGCIRGAKSTDKLKSFPTIKVHGYCGSAGCVVSCVTKDGPPYYPHPHNLVGKNTNGDGVCYRTISESDMTCSFPNLGIQCVKKKDIKESLLQRQKLQVDPFGTGFSHYSQSNKINLNAVRLCFQVFIADSSGKLNIPLSPVISDPIFDNKAVSDLNITKLSHYSSPVTGGQEMILLCDQVNKDDIEILFYEKKDDHVVWSSNGHFFPHHVHRKAAISFTSPPYKVINISQAVKVYIQLRRPSDGATGKPNGFTYLPLKYDPDGLIRKKEKFDALALERLLQSVGNEDQDAFAPRTIKKAVRKKTKNDGYPIESTSKKPTESDNQPHPLPSSLQGFNYCDIVLKYSPSSSYKPISNNSHLICTPSTHPPANENIHAGHNAEDISAIATDQISGGYGSDIGINAIDPLERFASLDLSLDPKDLDMNIAELNVDSFESSGFNFAFSSGELKYSPKVSTFGQ